jgi:uridine kinase
MSDQVVVIGIAGASGSGKSLLAKTIVNELGSEQITVISEDSYYKDLGDMPLNQKAARNFDHPEAFDHHLFAQHLEAMKQGQTVQIPIYDYATHSRTTETRTIGNHRLVILEGILLFVDEELRNQMDILIYVDTPLDICLIRRMTRDIVERGRTLEGVLAQYQETVRPMYLQFIEPSKRYADVIVPRGGKNRIAIDMIKAKMHQLLIDTSENV